MHIYIYAYIYIYIYKYIYIYIYAYIYIYISKGAIYLELPRSNNGTLRKSLFSIFL